MNEINNKIININLTILYNNNNINTICRVARIIASESDRRVAIENEVRELRGKLENLETLESIGTLELPRAYDAVLDADDDLRKELEHVKRLKKEEIWKVHLYNNN